MKTKPTLALAAILTSCAFAEMPAKLPEFMNPEQLAKWRAETAAENAAKAKSNPSKPDAQSPTLDVPTPFFTGKPFIESTGTYAFKYRSYNPVLARWTSEDPSGFPDGANGNIYAPSPTYGIDFMGLWKVVMTSTGNNSQSNYNWVDNGAGVTGIGSVRVGAAPNVAMDSITMNCSGYAVYSGCGVQADQQYTVNVDANGNLSFSISGPSTAKKDNEDASLTVAIRAVHSGQGSRTLDFDYYVAAQRDVVDITGYSVSADGASSITWNTSNGGVSGNVPTVRFMAVE